ncbi:MAG: DEAD/DEAH box helicase family protein [Epsilonproteobacteria bacterium]|nr:DEAD/DEAH box helicase family protein [Campylobacterota bacterium]
MPQLGVLLLFSFFSSFSSSKIVSEDTPSDNNAIFEDLTSSEEAVYFIDFTLFHHESHFNIDLLLFLPHYGLYLGEKILWNLQELKGASVKRLTRQSHALSHTHLESTEKVIYQKLQDVLSFDSTPLERIFWMKNLTCAEFETLDPSFHELLPKGRLIFKDDTALAIQSKLHALHEYQAHPFSKLKVIGSLRAHTLLLPTATDTFGSFLSPQQQLFLDAPIKTRSILSLSADHGSGKSTVLIRKVLDYLLTNSHHVVIIMTPTRLSGELLRNEFISLMEFAAVECNLSNLYFYTPSSDNEPLETTRMFQESTLIVCDDTHLLCNLSLQRIIEHKGSRALLMCGVTKSLDTDSYTLNTLYRKPILNTVHFAHTKGALFTLLTGLKTHLETTSSHLIMIILPNHEMLLEYKKAIENHLQVKCRILNDTFSLQYDNLEEITLSTPHYISGLNVPHSYLINLNNDDSLYYPLTLSRASDTVTIISESNLEG